MLRPLELADVHHVISIWNSACGPDLAIRPDFLQYNLQSATGSVRAAQLAIIDNHPVGFVHASAFPNDPSTSPPEIGWVDAIAVLPEHQHRGVGSQLLSWARSWLQSQGCTRVRLGGSLRHFVAGYPSELGTASFFRNRGFMPRVGEDRVWDVARDLRKYQNPKGLRPFGFECRPAQAADVPVLTEFLLQEFPGRWRFEFQEFLRAGGRITDWMILLTKRGVDGFARICLEDSVTPINRVYPWKLPRPWGQLGSLGVSADVRGKGLGSALLNSSLIRLRAQGVRGCVIDWTDLLDFYARFGFRPYREYLVLIT